MAALISRDNGSRFILFKRDGKRHMIYLGQIDFDKAEIIRLHVEELVAAKLAGSSPEPDTLRWLKKIDDQMAAKLAKVDLIEPRRTSTEKRLFKLESFIDEYLARRTKIKHWTRSNCQQAKRNLVAYFGASRDIRTITLGDAKDWREWLEGPAKLAENTARRHAGRGKQFFNYAVDKGLIAENPFRKLVCRVRGSGDERLHFVTRAEADKVLNACRNNQWRLVFALARYAGLRCPSEHSELRVKEIDLAVGQMKVRSPKTEHLPGGSYRMVKIEPELRPYLEAAIAELPKDAEYVVALSSVVRCRGCECSSNLGTEMARTIKRAGVKVWPKLFQNCRASCEIEWAAKYGVSDACQLIGNTIAVAQEHYLWATQHRLIETETSSATGEAQRNAHHLESQHAMEKTDIEPELLAEIVEKCRKNGTLRNLLVTLGNSGKSQLVPRVGLEPTTY